MVKIEIEIKADDIEAAAQILEDIALCVESGIFSATCSKKNQERFGGTVFVTDDEI